MCNLTTISSAICDDQELKARFETCQLTSREQQIWSISVEQSQRNAGSLSAIVADFIVRRRVEDVFDDIEDCDIVS